MAFVIQHDHHGLYLGSNQQTRYWSFIPSADQPPAAQTFASVEDAIAHVSSWPIGNIPSAYTYIKIEDHGSGYVFETEALAQGFPGWSDCSSDPAPATLFTAA